MANLINKSRRAFLERALTLAGGAVLGSLLASCDGGSAPTPPPAAPKPAPKPSAPKPAPKPAAQSEKVSPDEDLAKSLKYVENVAEADMSANPAFKEGSNCSNCSLYSGKEGEEWGGCTIFGGRKVKAAGWCASYAKKAG